VSTALGDAYACAMPCIIILYLSIPCNIFRRITILAVSWAFSPRTSSPRFWSPRFLLRMDGRISSILLSLAV
jgi:hypothetical protein